MYKKILIINPFGIGDVLFTTPIIHTLKDTSPEVKIGYLCNARSAPLLKNNPHLDYIFIYERDEFEQVRKKSFLAWLKKILIFIKDIRKEHFDLALDFSLNTQYGFFSWCAGINERIGYDYKKRGKFLTNKIEFNGYNNDHVIDYYNSLLSLIEIESKYHQLEVYTKEEDLQKIQSILDKNNADQADFLIGIAPGAGMSWGNDAYLKHWPTENFAKLADKLIEKYKTMIIILGDFPEKEITEKLWSAITHKDKVINLAGKTNLTEFAALLSKLRLVITNDGGPLHMAVAAGAKTISIFGPVSEIVYGPYPKQALEHIAIKKDLVCRPCYQNFRLAKCDYNRKCIQTISIEEVFEAARKLLE